MINAAIVGLGWWGRNIVGAVQGKSAKIRFVHGISQEPDAVRDLAREKGFRLSTSLDDALRDPEVQAVVLATPHSKHAEHIIAVAQARKPVFCEKPLCLTRKDAIRATDAVRSAGVPMGVGHNKHFWPGVAELRRVVASGVLGQVMHIEGHYSNENSSKFFAPWRDDPRETPGAGMTGTGMHILEVFSSIAGPAEQVTAQFCQFRGGKDPLDTVSALFRFRNGMSGFLGAVRPSPIHFRAHVYGSHGNAEALGENELVLRLTGKPVERKTLSGPESLLAEFDAFADAVEGRAPYPISVDRMVDIVGMFEATYRSMERNQPVRIDAL